MKLLVPPQASPQAIHLLFHPTLSPMQKNYISLQQNNGIRLYKSAKQQDWTITSSREVSCGKGMTVTSGSLPFSEHSHYTEFTFTLAAFLPGWGTCCGTFLMATTCRSSVIHTKHTHTMHLGPANRACFNQRRGVMGWFGSEMSFVRAGKCPPWQSGFVLPLKDHTAVMRRAKCVTHTHTQKFNRALHAVLGWETRIEIGTKTCNWSQESQPISNRTQKNTDATRPT